MGYPTTMEELAHVTQSLWVLTFGLLAAVRGAVRRYLGPRRTIPVEVLVKNRAQRRAIERDLHHALRRLQRALGGQFPVGVTVLVQHVICADRQLAGCYQVSRRPDGDSFALIRLALEIDGRQLRIDEILSVLAEQCIGLAVHQSGGAGVLVPIELSPTRRTHEEHIDALRPDPLRSAQPADRDRPIARVS
ncbi:MAG: hypothetical protein IT305_00900 [Chloroflexi bacterium]|nr:hypothetical protein [Chloroflexota bacterium]